MNTLNGKSVRLRALEPEDLSFLQQVENDESNWEISHTKAPFSLYILKEYLKNAHLDIYETKQLRLVIENINLNEAIGIIDLFDFNPKHLRAGVGIIINPSFQGNGFAKESIQLLKNYVFTHLHLHQLYANILSNNSLSINVFEKCGFKKVGIKKDWIFSNNSFKDEILFQLINK